MTTESSVAELVKPATGKPDHRAKLAWARKHIQQLRAEVDAFNARYPY